MRIICSVLVLLMAQSSLALVKIEKKSVVKEKKAKVQKRNVASVDSATEVLRKIVGCIETSQNVSGLRACASNYLSKDLKPSQRDRLLYWFDYSYELSVPEECKAEELSYMPEELTGKYRLAICSNYEKVGRKKRAYFFFTQEGDSLRLRNLR